MKLTPPTFGVWLIALLLGGGGIAAKFGYVPVLAPHAFWLVVAGFGLLAFEDRARLNARLLGRLLRVGAGGRRGGGFGLLKGHLG